MNYNYFCFVTKVQQKTDKNKEQREKTHHKAHRHSTRLACARRVSSPPSIPKSCFPIFPFKRVCACFPFPLFFNRSIPTKREICSANRKIRNNEGILLFPNFRIFQGLLYTTFLKVCIYIIMLIMSGKSGIERSVNE